ncbi:hypothetical protein P2H44_18585 [Albimonas sp. CAU 1670]|uniref:hypothetical protein n=1 Tax=Albimonas sp. CAU 1670 TaxID=3032599 RepID=UPI0023D998AE|nr:hypothetical protein [Albimonas sp. CAU 1670]MDF2234572.1 hypothetical protein [Albimonas sp. CAU 1670]
MQFDDATFFSVWYWALTAVFWSMASYFTHGVPWDMLRRALREGGEDAYLCDAYARRMILRIDAFAHRWGAATGATVGFLLAMLATLGFLARSELALGLLMLAGPAALMVAAQAAEARRIAPRLHEIDVEPLLAALYRRRAANRLAGMAAVVVSVAVLGYLNVDRIVNQGGW